MTKQNKIDAVAPNDEDTIQIVLDYSGPGVMVSGKDIDVARDREGFIVIRDEHGELVLKIGAKGLVVGPSKRPVVARNDDGRLLLTLNGGAE